MNDENNGLASWWAAPFTTNQNAFRWVLTVGLVIIAAFLWQLVLIQLTKEL